MKKIYLCCLVLVSVSCGQKGRLNFAPHRMGESPHKIIWLQMAGLSAQHLGLLKLNLPSANYLISFERAHCLGQIWTFNNYTLRPKASVSMWGQLIGKKNVRGTCEDFKKNSIWDYLKTSNIESALIEGESSRSESLLSIKRACGNDTWEKVNRELTYWTMNKDLEKKGSYFQNSNESDYQAGKTYFDNSCQQGRCYSTLSDNIFSTFKSFTKNRPRYLYMVRDFKFLSLLKRKKIIQAREYLLQMSKIFQYFIEVAKEDSSTLVLLNGVAPLNIEFPKAGSDWKKYEKSGKNILYKRTALLAPLFAFGARSENFCGVYEEAQIIKRMTESFDSPWLKNQYINPFE